MTRAPYRAEWKQTVRVDRRLGPDDFALDLPDGRATLRVIGVTPGLLVTDELEESVEVADGRIKDGRSRHRKDRGDRPI